VRVRSATLEAQLRPRSENKDSIIREITACLSGSSHANNSVFLLSVIRCPVVVIELIEGLEH
jgi:hypothetical protein